jgi:ankyrin repeat protein
MRMRSVYIKGEKFMYSRTEFVDAAREGDFDTVIRLLPTCGDVDVTDIYGGTALMYAVAAHREDVTKLLLEHGADVTKRDKDFRSTLDYAIVFGCSQKIVDMLKNAS